MTHHEEAVRKAREWRETSPSAEAAAFTERYQDGHWIRSDRVDSLLAAYRCDSLAEKWIAVTERLPPENHPVEVYGMKRLERAIAQLRNGDEWLIETCYDLINIYPPKFWRELSAPPNPLAAQERPTPHSTEEGEER